MIEMSTDYFDKAHESLEGAQSEFDNGRYNNCANRCYYAAFQAAIGALIRAGITPPSRSEEWGHNYLQAAFIGQLINRRKLYPSALRGTLEQNYRLRVVADYRRDDVTQVRASRAVGRTEDFIETIRRETEGQR
jgi:uncharacterized protein (UPF0332 family)